MKTLRNEKTHEVRRVTDNNATMLVKSSVEWQYIPKSTWKMEVRDKKQDKPAEE